MKNIITLLIVSLFFLTNSALAEEDEIRDFGIRIGAGVLQGVGDPLKEVSAYADMYLLSQQTRMVFGFSLYDTDDTDIPSMSIQSIGIEQNIRLFGGEAFVGVIYNKSYLKTKMNRFDTRRGEAYHIGYKYPVERHEDIVITLGQQYRPLSHMGTTSKTKLNKTSEYLRVAYQWYF